MLLGDHNFVGPLGSKDFECCLFFCDLHIIVAFAKVTGIFYQSLNIIPVVHDKH